MNETTKTMRAKENGGEPRCTCESEPMAPKCEPKTWTNDT